MGITFRHRGSFKKTEKFLNDNKKRNYRSILEKYAREGLELLRAETPEDTGLTADSWNFEIIENKSGFKIVWTNSNIVDGVPVAILIQYGHGTQSGTYVEGRDFINPVMQPLFDRISENIWKEVISS